MNSAQAKAFSTEHRSANGWIFISENSNWNSWSHRLYIPILLLPIDLSLLVRVLCFEFASVYLEEIHRLLWVLASNIVESASGDIVRLALSYQRIVLQQILDLGSVRRCLRTQDPLRFSPTNIIRTANFDCEATHTYSEISSNCISVPKSWVAASASSSPAASIGPELLSWVPSYQRQTSPVRTMSWPRCLSSNPCLPLPERTCATTRATS